MQRWTSLLLIIAFLHGVLAPVVGLAAGKQDFARIVLAQLCGTGSERLIEIALDHEAEPDAFAESGHGGFCLLCAHPATPVDNTVAGLPDVSTASHPLRLPDHVEPRFAAVWTPALARAPPFTS